MEWRQQSSVSCKDAFTEAQRWIEEVTGKSFGCRDFRPALENGVLLCDLINKLKPGIIKRMNRLSTPIAGLDNVNVFLKACGKLGLNESQLFHPGDLQDLSTRVTLRRDESQRRLKNVLITVYWLGRKAQLDTFYSGPQLNFKAFEGLLGLALSKALEEGSNTSVKDGVYKECHFSEGEQSLQTRQNYDRGNSVDGFECVDPPAGRLNEEGFESDAEAEQVYKMDSTKDSTYLNKGRIPLLLRRKQGRDESMVGQIPRAYQTQIRPETPVQVNPGWIWSKSLSDIPMVYPVRKVSNGNAISDKGQDTSLAKDWNLDIERKYSVGARDSEAQWQDDLTRWKNRRKSSKPELYRRSFERDHVNHFTNGTVINSDGNEAPGGPIKRDQSPWRHSSSPRPYSVSPSKPLSSDLRPHTKVILTHSYTTEAPFSSQSHSRESQLGGKPESGGSVREEETYSASLAADGRDRVTTPSPYQTFTTQTQVKSLGNQFSFPSTSEQKQPENVLPYQNSCTVKFAELGPFDNKESTRSNNSALYQRSFSTEPKLRICSPDVAGQSGVTVTEDQMNRIKKSQETSKIIDSVEDGVTCQQDSAAVSKYLSRSTWSSSASLPRGYRRSEGSTRLSSAITATPFGTKPSRHSLPRQYNADCQSLMSNTEESHSSFTRSSFKRQTAAAHLRGQYQASIRQKKASQVRQTATAQKEEVNSRPSTHIQPQPSAKKQPCHNKSFVLAYNAGADLSKVDHSDMRVSLTLKPNSVPDFGFQTQWDSTGVKIKSIRPGSPAENCQLCVGDEIVAVDGVALVYMTYSQWKDKMASSLQTGSLTMDIRRYGIKDWSMNRGSDLNRPKQSMLTLNLTSAAPVLIGRSDHHANNAASTEMTQESQFNGQRDDETQDKAIGALFSGNASDVRRKENNSITTENQKKRTEFFSQKGGSESAISDIQVPSLNPSSSTWCWDREEDRRRQEKWQEEQERLLQEQYQRDQERLEAEWQRAQQAAIEGGMLKENTAEQTSGCEKFLSSQLCVNGLTKETKDEKLNLNRDRKDAELKLPNDAHRVQNNRNPEKDWAEGSHVFAQLSHAHRAMSMSTPSLSGPYKQTRVDPRKGRALTISKAERERLQILEEMKKRTQLLTDNSWIRQRSGSFHKEPVEVHTSMKRYESLDNLDILHQGTDSAPTFTYPRPNSAAAVYNYQNRNASTRYSTGSISFQRNANMESFHHARMISGRRTCCMCERALGSGAAMVIDALSLCFHLTCFQCVGCHQHIGGTETGVQVRIRNRKPYCDYCYFQLKYTAFHM